MRFQGKVFLAFAMLLVLVVGLLLFTSFRFERDLLLRVEGGLQDIVHTVNVSTREIGSHEAHNTETLKTFMARCLELPGVEKVSIISNRERIILSSDTSRIGQRAPLPGGEDILVVQRLSTHHKSDWHVRYDLRMPIIRANKVIGAVWLELALADFGLLFRDLFVKTLFIASAGLAIAFTASLVILHRLGRPLRALSQASKRIYEGDLAVRVDTQGGDEFQGVGLAFNTMVEQLEEKKRLEERLGTLERHALLAEMAAHLAHEIRNPLNLIHLTVDQLRHESKDKDRMSHDGEMLDSIKAATRHLDQVLQRFLELGKPERLKRAKLSLIELTQDMRLLLNQRIKEKSIALEIAIPEGLSVIADREQLRLMLLNLLLNAVAMAPMGGRIVIAANRQADASLHSPNLTAPHPENLILSVSDDGPGIQPRDLEQVFEPYFTRREGGTGLGLALVRRIAEEHGGTVLASNQPGGGAVFTVTLPDSSPGEA